MLTKKNAKLFSSVLLISSALLAQNAMASDKCSNLLASSSTGSIDEHYFASMGELDLKEDMLSKYHKVARLGIWRIYNSGMENVFKDACKPTYIKEDFSGKKLYPVAKVVYSEQTFFSPVLGNYTAVLNELNDDIISSMSLKHPDIELSVISKSLNMVRVKLKNDTDWSEAIENLTDDENVSNIKPVLLFNQNQVK